MSETHAKYARMFCNAFKEASPETRFVFGTGEHAQSIARATKISAFVDNYSPLKELLGLPVIRPAALPENSLLVIGSIIQTAAVMHSLDGLPISLLDYYSFARYSGLDVKQTIFTDWEGFTTDYAEHKSRYDKVHARLADSESREIFARLTAYRLSGDIKELIPWAKYDLQNQYFEDFLELKPSGESFLDIGGFDGATSLEFARRCPEFDHISIFEPDPVNLGSLKQNLSHLPSNRVTVYECGLSDRPGVLSFESGQDSSSHISHSGDTMIKVKRLDDLDIPSATFLKIDIEGGETSALLGARETIKRFRPRMAISAYHLPGHFWRIPDVVDSFGVNYEIRMRHYTQAIYETVLFFLPLD